MKTPLVSVIMPAYNAERFIEESIESILNQTYRNLEFIIIDDGSTDGTNQLIRRYAKKDPRIITITRENGGYVSALNLGIEKAKGELIARMDADDISRPDRIAKQVSYLLANLECTALFSRIQPIDENGIPIDDWPADAAAITFDEIKKLLHEENCLAHPTLIIRAEIIKQFKYNVHQPPSEDYDLWLRLLSSGKELHKLNEKLVLYRVHADSVSQTSIRQSSPQKKYLQVKSRFLINQLKSLHFGLTELRVLKTVLVLFFSMAFKKGRLSLAPDLKVLVNQAPRLTKTSRILFILPWMEMGGADKVVLSVMEGLKKKNKKNKLFCATTVPSANEWREEFAKLCEDIADFSNLEVHIGIAEQIAKYAADHSIGAVIISNSVSGYVAAEIIKHQSPQTRIVDIVHGQGGKEEKGGIPLHSAPYSKFLDKRATVTEYMKNYLIKRYGVAEEKIEVIHNGIEMNKSKLPPADEIKPYLDKYLVLWSGRFNVEKHPELVIDIAEKVSKKSSGVHFVLAGDGPLKKELIKTVQQKNLNEYVTFTPKAYKDYGNYIPHASMLLMTSEMEGLPIVILEAFSESKPVIAPDVGGIPELVKDGVNGYLIKFGKDFANEAAKKIQHLSSHASESESLGKKGFQLVRTEFSLRDMQNKYSELILERPSA